MRNGVPGTGNDSPALPELPLSHGNEVMGSQRGRKNPSNPRLRIGDANPAGPSGLSPYRNARAEEIQGKEQNSWNTEKKPILSLIVLISLHKARPC